MKLIATVLCLLITAVTYANTDLYAFETDQQRALFGELSQSLRCPKCQNQNLADSNSEIASIMREVIAEEVLKGSDKQAIEQMMVER